MIMHFVDKSKIEENILNKLAELTISQTPLWIEYFSKKEYRKIPVSYWNEPIIKDAIVNEFQKNCGYCGYFTREITTIINKNTTYEGEIDHYLPKSKNLELIYDWKNYIWTCKGCNVHKLAYTNKNLMILNPTNLLDVENIKYINGKYLIETTEENLINRFKITQAKLLINIEDNIGLRQQFYKRMFERLDTILINFKLNLIENYKEEIINLKNDLKKESFKLLFRDVVLPNFKKRNSIFTLNHTDFGIN